MKGSRLAKYEIYGIKCERFRHYMRATSKQSISVECEAKRYHFSLYNYWRNNSLHLLTKLICSCTYYEIYQIRYFNFWILVYTSWHCGKVIRIVYSSFWLLQSDLDVVTARIQLFQSELSVVYSRYGHRVGSAPSDLEIEKRNLLCHWFFIILFIFLLMCYRMLLNILYCFSFFHFNIKYFMQF